LYQIIWRLFPLSIVWMRLYLCRRSSAVRRISLSPLVPHSMSHSNNGTYYRWWYGRDYDDNDDNIEDRDHDDNDNDSDDHHLYCHHHYHHHISLSSSTSHRRRTSSVILFYPSEASTIYHQTYKRTLYHLMLWRIILKKMEYGIGEYVLIVLLLSTYLQCFTHLYINLSIHPRIYLSIYLFIHSFIYLSIYLFIHSFILSLSSFL